MTREWKPGDVASTLRDETQVALRTSKGWTYVDGSTGTTAGDDYDFRPLVVIDPEDREQVAELRHALPLNPTVDEMQAALREFANPTPPKPEEPTGKYAVVVDSDGDEWIKDGLERDGICSGTWWCVDRARRVDSETWRANYADISAVRILSEGVPA